MQLNMKTVKQKALSRLRRSALASTKASVEALQDTLLTILDNMSVQSKRTLSKAFSDRFDHEFSFEYMKSKDIITLLSKIEIGLLINFLVENNIISRNDPVLQGFQVEKAFVMQQNFDSVEDINNLVLTLTTEQSPKLGKHKTLIYDWLVENKFDFEVVDNTLEIDKKEMRRLTKFITDVSKWFVTHAPNAPYTSYYKVDKKDYSDAFKVLGINLVNGDLRSIRIVKSLVKLSKTSSTEFELADVDQVGLQLYFDKIKVPVNIINEDEVYKVTVLGCFPQDKDVTDEFNKLTADLNDIKIPFPSTFRTKVTSLSELVNEIGTDNIRKAEVPVSTWTGIYTKLIKCAEDLDESEDSVEADTKAFGDIIEALHLDRTIDGIPDNILYQLTNDGTLVLVNKPGQAQQIADALLEAIPDCKAKVNHSKFGTVVNFDSKKVYNYFMS